jgi:homoserine kinase type II
VGALTRGLLHTDPAPEAFRLAAHGDTCGVIDWSVAMSGPLLYDLASAVMYVGGPDAAAPLVEAYLRIAPVTRDEVRHGLATMVRFRWAAQADYFAARIATHDLTGIAGAAGNERGLADAEAHLSGSRFRPAARGYGAAHDVPGGVQRW